MFIGLDLLNKVGDAGIHRRSIGLTERDALGELGCPATEATGLFNQQHIIAGLGRFERRGHTGDAATNHQNALVVTVARVHLRHLHLGRLGAGHAHVVVGHLLHDLLLVFVGRRNPDHALAQVGARQRDVVKIKRIGLGAARAGGDHHVIHAFFCDVVLDQLHAAGVAQELVRLHHLRLALFLRDQFELRRVQTFAQAATFADVGTDFHVSHFK